MLVPPHRGERISPRQNEHDERFASTERRRPGRVVLLLCPVSDTPLMRFVRFAGTGLFLKYLIFQFFKDLPSKIVIFASPFLHLLLTTHTFFPDLPRNSSTLTPKMPCKFPFRGSWLRYGSLTPKMPCKFPNPQSQLPAPSPQSQRPARSKLPVPSSHVRAVPGRSSVVWIKKMPL